MGTHGYSLSCYMLLYLYCSHVAFSLINMSLLSVNESKLDPILYSRENISHISLEVIYYHIFPCISAVHILMPYFFFSANLLRTKAAKPVYICSVSVPCIVRKQHIVCAHQQCTEHTMHGRAIMETLVCNCSM